MRSIRIIADDHIACTISLAKAFVDKGIRVQYVYITAVSAMHGLEGVNIDTKLALGINRVRCSVHDYIKDDKFDFVIFRYPRPFDSIKGIQWFIQPILTLFFFLYRTFWKQKFDCVNFVGRYNSNIYCKILPYVEKKKLVFSLHEICDHFKNQFYNTPFMDYLLDQQPKLIFHSNSLMDSWKKQYPNYKGERKRIYFGKCDSFLSCNYKKALIDIKDYILFFGFFKSYKGLDNILQLLKKNPQLSEIPFVLAGAGTLPEIEDLKTFHNVTILNKYISNDELSSLIYNCKAVICPYHTVSQSGVVQTAYAFNKPVIAPNLAAFEEGIIDRATGYLYPFNSIDDCAIILDNIYKKDDEYLSIVHNIEELDRVLPDLSWSFIANEYIGYIEKD